MLTCVPPAVCKSMFPPVTAKAGFVPDPVSVKLYVDPVPKEVVPDTPRVPVTDAPVEVKFVIVEPPTCKARLPVDLVLIIPATAASVPVNVMAGAPVVTAPPICT